MASTQVIKGGAVQLEGLDELRRTLRKIDKTLPKDLAKINKKFSERVAKQGRDNAAAKGGIWKHMAPGVISAQRAAGVFVGLNSAKAPGVFGAEFGGGKFGPGHPTWRGGHTTQFGPHRRREGGPMWEAIHGLTPQLVEQYRADIETLTKSATGR